MTRQDAIENRTNEVVEEASEEVVLVFTEDSLRAEERVGALNEFGNGVELLVDALAESLQDGIQTVSTDGKNEPSPRDTRGSHSVPGTKSKSQKEHTGSHRTRRTSSSRTFNRT